MSLLDYINFHVGDIALFAIKKDQLIEVEVTRIYEEEPMYQVSWWDDTSFSLKRRDVYSHQLYSTEGEAVG